MDISKCWFSGVAHLESSKYYTPRNLIVHMQLHFIVHFRPNVCYFQMSCRKALDYFSLWVIFQVNNPAKYEAFQVRMQKTINYGNMQVLCEGNTC